MIIVIILLIPTAIFLVRSFVSLGVFLKWNKKERLTGTVGKQLDVKPMSKMRRYIYEFTIERGDETVRTELQEVKSNGRDPTVVQGSKIERGFCNGQTSWKYYHRFQEKELGIEAAVLPSTSPANAAWSIERLAQSWKIILE